MIDKRIVLREHPALVFVNPTSGGGKALSYLPQIQRLFKELGFPAEFVQTDAASHMTELVRKAVRDGRKLFFAMGGDGTLQDLVNAVHGADVVVGVIPAGGGNDFAAALGLPKNPIDAARAMLGGESRSVDLLKVVTADEVARLYVGGGGIGLDAESAQYAGTIFRGLPGRLRYLFSALTALSRFKPLRVTATFPESNFPPVEFSALLAAALNAPTYGAGLRLAPDAAVDDGWLDVVLLQNLHWYEVLFLLPRLFLFGELKTTRLTRVRAKKVLFTTDRPCVFHCDGETLGSSPVAIEVVPNAIRVLAPVRPRDDSK